MPCARRRRADGRHPQSVDAGLGRSENTVAGNRAFCNLNEGLGRVLRFGANSPDVLERLRWLGSEFFAAMRKAVSGLADANLKPLMAQALHMGDELHNRNAAASALLFKRLTLSLLGSGLRQRRHPACARLRRRQRPLLPEHLDGRVQDDVGRRARGARQQPRHGDGAQRRQVRRSPLGHRRPMVPGPGEPDRRALFPGYSIADANRRPGRLGDHRNQWPRRLRDGGVARHRAVRRRHRRPTRPQEQPTHAVDHARDRTPAFTLPAAQLRRHASPASTLASSPIPAIPADHQLYGIAHRKAGVGQIGAGITTAPMACFSDALAALAKTLSSLPGSAS